MANILAIDASTSLCSVALLVDGDLLERSGEAERSHAQHLLPMVAALLDDSGVAIEQLDGLAYSAGPGSFTGLRIGLGVAQGLAFGADIPMISVSSLQAMARGVGDAHDGLFCCVLDARMSEVYWSIYRQCNGDMDTLVEPRLDGYDRASAAIVETVAACTPEQPRFLLGADGQCLSARASECFEVHSPDVRPRASAVAQLALRPLQRGECVAPENAQLMYLRNSVSWNKRQRIRQER